MPDVNDFGAFWPEEDMARAEERRQQQAEGGPTEEAPQAEAKPNGVDPNPWPVLDDLARYGLAGEVVDAITPHSEADPAALLIQFLASFGNVLGRGPHYRVEGDRHFTNLYSWLVGPTAKARKGVSRGRIEQIMQFVDPEWVATRVDTGLSSGEGLISAVRDPLIRMEKVGKGADAERVPTIVDDGVADKRLYIIEPEFAGVLAAVKREGNTLSRVIRDAWDRGNLATITKTSPVRATGAHISIVGHITAEELRRDLDRTSIANGFANRFLIVCARRAATLLPFGGNLSEATCRQLGAKICTTAEKARQIGEIGFARSARAQWEALYPALSDGQPGLLGALLARAEAHVVRLALHYALLDGCAEILSQHLTAAAALWEYAEGSARYVFGDALGDPVADEIMIALRQAGGKGMTRTQIRDLFGRNRSADQIGRALATLERAGKARRETRKGVTRPFEYWVAS